MVGEQSGGSRPVDLIVLSAALMLLLSAPGCRLPRAQPPPHTAHHTSRHSRHPPPPPPPVPALPCPALPCPALPCSSNLADVRRAVFCVVMGSEDCVDAVEKLLRLGLRGEQEREVARVTVECCLQVGGPGGWWVGG